MDRLDLVKISRNFSYDISVDRHRNCLYVSLVGLWDKSSSLEYYTDDFKEAVKELSAGYSLVIDLIQYRGSTPDFFQLHIDTLHYAVESGVGDTVIIQPENPMLRVAMEYIIKLAGINVSYFSNMSSAEKWLDSK